MFAQVAIFFAELIGKMVTMNVGDNVYRLFALAGNSCSRRFPETSTKSKTRQVIINYSHKL